MTKREREREGGDTLLFIDVLLLSKNLVYSITQWLYNITRKNINYFEDESKIDLTK